METTDVVKPINYLKDGPFKEPVIRCDGCSRLILLETVKNIGGCNHCGNRRIRNVQTITEDEMPQVKQWIAEGKCDQGWLDDFVQIDENQPQAAA